MGTRLGPIGGGVDWTAGFRQGPELILRAAEATARGTESFGQSVGQGLRALGAGIHAGQLEKKADKRYEDSWQIQLRQENRLTERDKVNDAHARAQMGMSLLNAANAEEQQLWERASTGLLDPEDPAVQAQFQAVASKKSSLQAAIQQAMGQRGEAAQKAQAQAQAATTAPVASPQFTSFDEWAAKNCPT